MGSRSVTNVQDQKVTDSGGSASLFLSPAATLVGGGSIYASPEARVNVNNNAEFSPAVQAYLTGTAEQQNATLNNIVNQTNNSLTNALEGMFATTKSSQELLAAEAEANRAAITDSFQKSLNQTLSAVTSTQAGAGTTTMEKALPFLVIGGVVLLLLKK